MSCRLPPGKVDEAVSRLRCGFRTRGQPSWAIVRCQQSSAELMQMCSPVRFSSAAAGVLLGLLGVGTVDAQSLQVNGNVSATVPAAPDYAAEVKGDPWDFEQSSDYVYTYSLGSTQTSYEYTAWQPYPTVQNGLFTGVTREPKPSLQMLPLRIVVGPGRCRQPRRTGDEGPRRSGRIRRESHRVTNTEPGRSSTQEHRNHTHRAVRY